MLCLDRPCCVLPVAAPEDLDARVLGAVTMETAAFTMVWNEAERLPRWLAYYGGELGRRNLFVLDDGSDDGSTESLHEVNVVRLPRKSAFDELSRVRLVSDFATGLLREFRTIIYSDVDEFIIPKDAGALGAALARSEVPTITTIGFDVMHRSALEPSLLPSIPIMAQRQHARFNATYSKPLVTKVPISWRPGFHFSDQPIAFDGLILFHTRYADLETGLRRLKQSRQVSITDKLYTTHWNAPDEDFAAPLQRANNAKYQEFSPHSIDVWEDLMLKRLQASPQNAIALIRDLPDLHPSDYRFPAAFQRVG